MNWRLLVTLALSFASGIFSLEAADPQSPPPPLRPFYIIGHGANTLARAAEYLAAGANALEVDVNVLADNTNALCIGHGPKMGIGATAREHAVPLSEFLTGLRQLASSYNLSLVYFDCKVLAATPEHGAQLLASIRKDLVGSGSNHIDVVTLISVGKPREKALFTDIQNRLGPREGLMVDGYSDPAAVSRLFTTNHVAHQAFSDGIVPMNPFLGQFMVLHAVRKACRLRDHDHQIRFVGTWSVNNPWCMKKYIKMGVDGLVADRGPVWYNFCFYNWGRGISSLAKLVNLHGAELGIRLATPADNPFAVLPTPDR